MSAEQLQAAERATQRLSARQILEFVLNTEEGKSNRPSPWIRFADLPVPISPAIFVVNGDVLLTSINEAIVMLGKEGLAVDVELTQSSCQNEAGVPMRHQLQLLLSVTRIRAKAA